MARNDEWRTRAGSRVRLVITRRGEFIDCEGCRRKERVTGNGSARAAGAQHARRCSH